MNADSTQYLLTQAEQSLRSATARARAARTLSEVVQAMHPALPPQTRQIARSLPSYRSLQRTLEQTAEGLAKDQLSAIRQADEPERSKLLRKYQTQEWVHLRGNFPRLAHLVQREVLEMRSQDHRSKEQCVRQRPGSGM